MLVFCISDNCIWEFRTLQITLKIYLSTEIRCFCSQVFQKIQLFIHSLKCPTVFLYFSKASFAGAFHEWAALLNSFKDWVTSEKLWKLAPGVRLYCLKPNYLSPWSSLGRGFLAVICILQKYPLAYSYRRITSSRKLGLFWARALLHCIISVWRAEISHVSWMSHSEGVSDWLYGS